ncbi:ATP-binding protein [Rathayibacter tanaceti]|uniref:Serine-protein kinase RsbW n=2 Tax=Rathayibacter tanaceti TaxID=1671680 RepID=A0A162GNF2_9MICO|nr:ATP-binding protein [Rathayibacter tanaceti]KZX20368.1 serine-protein kinase RsbW [Rathayibacter tanaceti]QHC56606.1 hypothetical protein GSU10_13865 [Rathayibacter tanaceti]TCO36254.1 serine/threonine-protein kinase RsbW [Rathayibacter tanaceti]
MNVLVRSRLQLEPRVLAVRSVGDWLREAAQRLDPAVAASLLARAELAVHEACINVIDHAGLPSGAVIDLDLVLEDDRLTVRVTDAGADFDLARVPLPALGALQERGFGVKIIRSLVDGLSHRRTAAGNELTLTFDLGRDRA